MVTVRVSPCAPWPAILALLATTSCSAPPKKSKAPSLPQIETSVEYFAGDALAGPRDPEPSVRATEQVLRARIRMRCFESFPDAALQPISAETRLVLASRGDDPILPSTQLSGSTRIGRGDVARSFLERCEAAPWTLDESEEAKRARGSASRDAMPRSQVVVDQVALLLPGVTAKFSASGDREFDVVGEGRSRNGVRVQLSPVTTEEREGAASDAATVTLVLEDAAPSSRSIDASTGTKSGRAASDGPASAGPATTGPSSKVGAAAAAERDAQDEARLRREILVLDSPLRVGEGATVILLPPLRDGDPTAWALQIDLERVAASSATKEIEACRESVKAAAASLARELDQPSDDALRRRQIDAALSVLRSGEQLREALLLLVGSRETLLTDIAMTLPEARLAGLAASLGKLDAKKISIEAGELAWTLERRTWQHCVARAQEGKLGSVLESILLAHAGELARYPSTLASFAARSESLEDMRGKIVQENRLLLEDSSPASRVRAFDWLRLRGLAPEGFDPLASDAERKRVLAKLAAEAAAAEEEKAKGAGR